MQIGTYARTTEQVLKSLNHGPDFIDLRMDSDHNIEFNVAKKAMREGGVPCTLHLPSSPEWRPIDIAKDIIPYIDLGKMIEAEVLTFHSSLSTLFYDDDVIDTFLQSFPLAYDAADEEGMTLSIETLGHYYTELMLLFEEFPKVQMVLDIGHGQILSIKNRATEHIEAFSDRIVIVNVHDNNACENYKELLDKNSITQISKSRLLEMARECDQHLPIGQGTIDFESIFASLKEHQYDGRFLMMCADYNAFPEERQKFLDLWLSA